MPSVKEAAIKCQEFGAQGITIHPRPDERHITRKDVYELKPLIRTEYNIEGYPSEDFLKMVIEVQADQVTLVPDTNEQLTSDHGWDTWKQMGFLKVVVARLQEHGIRTSVFIDPDEKAVEGAAEIKTDRIELYTEPYATLYPIDRNKAIEPFITAAKLAGNLGIDVNAGHDLSLENLNFMHLKIPNLKEVSIGHALIADALYLGMEKTIQKYLDCLR